MRNDLFWCSFFAERVEVEMETSVVLLFLVGEGGFVNIAKFGELVCKYGRVAFGI